MDPIAKLRNIRDGLAGVTELLVALLDDLDGDENLEDTDEDKAVDDDRCDAGDSGDDEPWLSGYGYGDQDLERSEGDDEPSLGRLETVHQGSGTYGATNDCEHDPAELGEPETGI